MSQITAAIENANRLSRAQEIAVELRKGGLYDFYTVDGNTEIYFVTRKDFTNRRNDVTYTVNTMAQTCTCPDFQNRNSTCKHLMAVEIALEEIALEEAMCEKAEAEYWEMSL